MKNIVIASGLLVRDDTVLLVQCRYAGEAQPLWTLPGGRHEHEESLGQTVRREFFEETGLDVQPARIAYVSDSVDEGRDLSVVNCTFWVNESTPRGVPAPCDAAIVAATFVPAVRAGELLDADVLRVPVTAALSDPLRTHYFSFTNATVDVPFFGRLERAARRG